MPLLNRLKAMFGARLKAADSQGYIAASLSRLERRHDGKAAPFNTMAAVGAYSSWIYAAASINANAVASTPLRLYVRSAGAGRKSLWNTRKVGHRTKAYMLGDGRAQPSPTVMRKAAELGADFEEVTDGHPLLELLARSNPYTNGYDLTVLRVVWQELTGNAYLHIVQSPALGRPSELWPMPPQWTEIIPDEQRFIAGFRYGRSFEGRIDMEPEEVIHFKRPNPRDLFYGMGKLEAAWGAAEANAALHEMDLSFFANHARPDHALVVKGNASDEQLEALEKQIQTKLRGTRKSGHFLVTTADIELKPMQFPTKDLSGREEIVEEIAAVFGVPVSMLKANDPNLASATQGFAGWREMTVLPLCRMDEEVLNQRLLPLFGIEGDAVLAYDNPVPANRVQDLTERQAAVAGGWMTPNEARELYGLEAIEADPHANMLHVNGIPLGGAPAQPMLGASAGPGLQQAALATKAPEPLDAKAVEAASEVLAKVAAGQLTAGAAQALIQALGFPEAATGAMVAGMAPAPATAPQQAAAGDCVGAKVATLLAEGYPQDQAVAIAVSMCEGKGLEAALASLHGKAVGDIDTVPPKQVQDNARRALEVRAEKPESQRGMTEVGIARARDLSNGVALSEDTIRRMAAYFERHEVDKQGDTWKDQGKGWQAWMGWGGDEGWAWARRKVEEFDRARADKQPEATVVKACCDHATKVTSIADLWTKADTGELVNDKLLQGWLKGVDGVLKEQVKAVVRTIEAEGAVTADTLDRVARVLRSSRWNRELTEAMQPYIERALREGAALGTEALAKVAKSPAVAQLGMSSRQLDEYVQRASVRLASRASDAVNGTTEVAVRDLLGEGMTKGETTGELADRVQEWARGTEDEGSMTRRRATTIARTEAARAAATAEQDAWKATGVVKGKRWLLAPDACEFCEAASKSFGKDGVGLDEPFYSVGDTINLPKGSGTLALDYDDVHGPPLHPNCRCAVQPVLVDDFEDIAAEAERRIAGGAPREVKA